MTPVQYIVHLTVILVHKNSPIHGQCYHFDVRIHKNALLYGQGRHKADRVALGHSCGVCFETLACVFASAGAYMLVSIMVAAKP